MKIPESELIINSDGSVFHLHIKPQELSDNVILVGDPGRVDFFRRFFSRIEAEGSSREFVFMTGWYSGRRYTVLSTGIGTDNIDIVMTELDALANVDFHTREVLPEHRSLRILRIGTCGAVQTDIPLGSFIFSHISIGCDGLLNWYEGRESVVLPDFEKAFVEHCRWLPSLPSPYFVKASESLASRFADCTVRGMTISAPGFYGPQGRSIRQPLAMPDMMERIVSFRYGDWRITNIEMESSAIAAFAAKLGHEAGTVCCAIANRGVKSANADYKPRIMELVALCMEKLSF